MIPDKNLDEKIVQSIDDGLDRLDCNNEVETFEYNRLLKQKEIIEELPEKENVYIGDWFNVLEFNANATMKIILLTIGLTGIFSKEY